MKVDVSCWELEKRRSHSAPSTQWQQDCDREVLEDEEGHPQIGEQGRLGRVIAMHSSCLRGVRSEASAEEIEGKPGWSHLHETGPREADRGTAQRPRLVHVGHILVRLLAAEHEGCVWTKLAVEWLWAVEARRLGRV